MKTIFKRKDKKMWVFVLVFFMINFGLASAQDHSISVDYSFSEDVSVNKIVEFSSILLKVKTDRDAFCRYSDSEGKDYDDMDGGFDLSSGDLHEKSFVDLDDGEVYRYYVKCVEDPDNYVGEPYELKIILRINRRVRGQIILSEDPPLKAGMVDVELLTSKVVSQTPTLSYSFDGIVYKNLPLSGSEKVWRGHLLISESLDEAVLSFKFKAHDLEGNIGEEIEGDSIFLIDSVKPKMVSSINAIGYLGKIELEWYLDEEVDNFRVYRSLSPNSDYTDFYKFSGKSPFIDTLVEKGKTYYYRVAAVDEAGNEADLSMEVYATALISNDSSGSGSSGLSLELRGSVDNLLVEADSLVEDIDRVESSISLKLEKEKNLFLDLGLERGISQTKSELNSLKRELENYKLQDLSESELTKKLDSARLRMNLIKKKVPEDLVIVGEDHNVEEVSEGNIEESVLELEPYISDKYRSKSVKETLKLIKESNLKIDSYFYVAEVLYLDGSRKDISVVKRVISAELERDKNTFFVEIIPKNVVESASEISINNGNHQVVKEDPILSFDADSKLIIYSFNKKSSVSVLGDTKLVLVRIINEESIDSDSGITGFFLFDSVKRGYFGIIFVIFLVGVLLVYFFYLKKSNPSESLLEISKKLEEGLDLLKRGHFEESEEIYRSLKGLYSKLSKKEKRLTYSGLDLLRNKILIFDLRKGLEKLGNRRDTGLFKKLEKIYNNLSDDFKLEISYFFERVKRDMGVVQ